MIVTKEGIWFDGAKFEKEELDANLPEIRKQIEVCKRWIVKNCMQKAKICKRRTSSGLKEKVQKDSKIDIYNGAFIVAMQELGYKYEAKPDSFNCNFNVTITNI